MMPPQTARRAEQPPLADPMPVSGIDHLELYVGNAAHTAFFLEHALGFTEVAYAGLETGSRDRVSHVLQQGRIRLVVTGALGRDCAIGRFHGRHGDSVRTIALGVPDARSAYEQAVARGARAHHGPRWIEDEHGRAQLAGVAAYGDVIHTFVQRDGYDGPFLPGFARRGFTEPAPGSLLVGVDHVVGNVELGRMDEWVRFYETVFGMTEMIHLTDEDISTEYSALMSKVLTDGSGRIKFPINEPAEGKRKSQIEEFLDFHGGPGVQHLALTSTRTWAPCAPWGSSWTATTRATSCRSSPSRSGTGRPSSSRSSSATEPAASARETSRRCSRRSNASRSCGATSDTTRGALPRHVRGSGSHEPQQRPGRGERTRGESFFVRAGRPYVSGCCAAEPACAGAGCG
jgi:4-hydroxyphenylpyruvate dioxygenase